MAAASPPKLSRIAQEYFASCPEHWTPYWRGVVHRYLRQFEHWNRERGIVLRKLRACDLSQYCSSRPGRIARANRMAAIRRFLVWVSQHHPRVSPDLDHLFPSFMSGTRRPLPEAAERFLAEKAPLGKVNEQVRWRARRFLCLFHQWLEIRGIRPADFTRDHLLQFLAACDQRYVGEMRRKFRYLCRAYLDWLVQEGEIHSLDLSGLLPEAMSSGRRTISPSARNYLHFLPAVIKQGSADCHWSGLSRFFHFLKCHSIDENKLKREHIEAWLRALSDAGLAPATRCSYINAVRFYLRWRHDHGEISQDPEQVLRASDLPKIPKRLPRPFLPEVDLEIQLRLHVSDKILHKGILLMRRTGIRSNELWLLPDKCIHEDHARHLFLKVPVGKMNSERLVPISEETRSLVDDIRKRSHAARSAALFRFNSSSKLVFGPARRPAFYTQLRASFALITTDLSAADPMSMGLHRLRHTFATEMLSAGMSLFALMQILGHRHIGTTLIYAGLVQGTIHEEYFAAQERIKDRYNAIPSNIATTHRPLTPGDLADDLVRSLRRLRDSADPQNRARCARLIKRVEYLTQQIRTAL